MAAPQRNPPANPPPNLPSEKDDPPPASFPAPPPRPEATVPRHPNRAVLSVLCVVFAIYAVVHVSYVTDRKWVNSLTASVSGGFMGWALVMLWMEKAAEPAGPQGLDEKRAMGLGGGVQGQGPRQTALEVAGGNGATCRYCHRASQTGSV